MKLFILLLLVLSCFCLDVSFGSESLDPSLALEDERSKERHRLLNKLNEDAKKYGKSVKEFLSPADLSPEKKEYYDDVLKKLVITGNKLYPKSIKTYGRYASVIVSLEIDMNGVLKKASLLKKTEAQLINKFAIEVAYAAQPYPRFKSGVFDEEVNVVVITRTMSFNIDKKI